MILSFAMTTEAARARRKTVTRRRWTDKHAQKFIKRIGQLAEGWTASPHRKGKPFCKFRILHVYKEKTCLIPDSDWEAEGFAYMEEHGLLLEKDLTCSELWEQWREDPELETWVIRFEIVEVYEEVSQVA